jgi:hypothetical protein
VVLGNEVLDAMPVQLLQRTQGAGMSAAWWRMAPAAWQDRLTELRPPLEIEGAHDYLTEIHLQGDAFVRTLGERLQRGAAFSSTTASARASTTTRSATWARWSATTCTRWTAIRWTRWA